MEWLGKDKVWRLAITIPEMNKYYVTVFKK